MTGFELLGATLLHFLWQGALIAAIYAMVRQWVVQPANRYLLACGALGSMALAPVVTWMILRQPSLANGMGVNAYSVSASTGLAIGVASDWSRLAFVDAAHASSAWLSWVAVAWIAGVAIFCVRLSGGWAINLRLRHRRARSAPPNWQETLDGLRARARLSRPVRLLVSGWGQAPAVVGLLRPVVLVPAAALAGLPTEQLEALLLHELAHIRRYDHVLNALQGVVEMLLFYHPAVWWVSGHMRCERELCCDDATVALTGDAASYARALAEVGAWSLGTRPAEVAANGGNLAMRVARLLALPRRAQARRTSSALTAVAIVAVITAVVAAQIPGPQFKAASIKPTPRRSSAIIRFLPGRLEANASLRELMLTAFDLQPFQISGGSEWARSERYAVEATADGTPNHQQMSLMLRSLLENRFHLQTHFETQTLPVYALTIAPGGIRLPAPHGDCHTTSDVLGPRADPNSRMQTPGQGGQAPLCGALGLSLAGDGARMSGDGVTLTQLAGALSRVVGRTVADHTENPGKFSVGFDFTPDASTPALPPPPPGAAPAGGWAPSIFSALGRLGLRLESSTGPVRVLVIDHAGPPSAN